MVSSCYRFFNSSKFIVRMGKKKQDNTKLFDSWDLNRNNYFLFGFGILTITFGYILMATGETNSFRSVKFAPVILVIGYCVIIPISIFYKFQE